MGRRAPQPKCGRKRCNHSKSFHDGGDGRCLAMGCGCEEWFGLRESLMAMTREGVRQYAKTVGVSYSSHTKTELIDAIVAHDEELASA